MKVLVAVDGSDESLKTIRFVAGHPWPQGSLIRVLAIADKVHPSVAELITSGGSVEEAQRGLDEHCTDVADSCATTLRKAGLTAESMALEGNPTSVIVEEATRWQADLIVVGSHCRPRISRLLLGDVALAVATNARCSVLIIRETGTATREGGT
jgi:nucleotide-binding universal stress UspA family protein